MKRKVFIGVFFAVWLAFLLSCAATQGFKELSPEDQIEYQMLERAEATKEDLRTFFVLSKTFNTFFNPTGFFLNEFFRSAYRKK